MSVRSTKEFNGSPGMTLDWEDLKDSTTGSWIVAYLARGVKSFYDDPENVRGFEEWKRKRCRSCAELRQRGEHKAHEPITV